MHLKYAFMCGMAALTGLSYAAPASAPLPAHEQAETQALELAKAAIALRSVIGPDNKTHEVARLYAQALIKGGFDPKDVTVKTLINTEVTPEDHTAYIIARWPGSDPKLKPIVISGHMDVVEAKAADWTRDPFTPVVENGYLFGRGATDMKLDGTLAIASLLELKREGYQPRRSIIIQFSGDEETTMKTSAMIAEELKDSELVLNIDGGGGIYDEATSKPAYFTWQGAEKNYADFALTVTNPGGHSSEPRKLNAITELNAGLAKIAAYQFKPELNDIQREYFTKAAPIYGGETGAAMAAFAKNPADAKAIAVLSDNPAMVGKIGTTCVVTMINGGHGLNALPQRAQANVNCRIYPGHSRAAIMAELAHVAADPKITFEDVTAGSVATPPSPLRPDLVGAITRALGKVYPHVPIFPSQASGASDSMWFRHMGVPSYGVSPMFIKDSEDFSHGLNERTPLSNLRPGVNYYLLLLRDLTQ
jgi:carboxypeptidase PM20D1